MARPTRRGRCCRQPRQYHQRHRAASAVLTHELLVRYVHLVETILEDVTLIGIDRCKYSLQVHVQDRNCNALLCKKFNRKQFFSFFGKFHSCKFVMEACAAEVSMNLKHLVESVTVYISGFRQLFSP